MTTKKLWLTAEEVMELMQISRSSAYRLIKSMNDELSKMGFIVIPGRANAAFFNDHLYRSVENKEAN